MGDISNICSKVSLFILLLMLLDSCFCCDSWTYCEDFVFDIVWNAIKKTVASFTRCTCRPNIVKPGAVGCKYVFCCKFPRVCFCQKSAKLDNIWAGEFVAEFSNVRNCA